MRSLLGKTWQARGEFLPEKSLLENLLSVRGIEKEMLVAPEFSALLDPFLFRDAVRAMERIETAIQKQEPILLFGDYDLDGMSGTALLLLTLKKLGAKVSATLPARADGYGFQEKWLSTIEKGKHTLVITIDCGISNGMTVEKLQALGCDVIITDHHTVPERLPPALAILHPLVPGETFPDKNLTGAGVAFFLALGLLFRKYGTEQSTRLATQLLEFAVLGTVADCGMLIGQNRLITLLGLQALQSTRNPGLLALISSAGINPEKLTAEHIAFGLAPRLNVAGRLDHPEVALDLLGRDFARAPEIAAQLEQLNRTRQNMVEHALLAAEQQLSSAVEEISAIVLKSAEWPAGIIGLIAGKLAEKYGVPTVILEETAEKLTASCRGPEDFHFAKALQQISESTPEIFLNFGGHALAAGFSMLPEKFALFQKIFSEIVRQKRGEIPPPPRLLFDGIIQRITPEEVTELEICQPFGTGNPAPQFLWEGCQVHSMRAFGNTKNHLQLELQNAQGEALSAVFFQKASLLPDISTDGKFDVIAMLELDMWQGRGTVRLKIQDMRQSSITN